MPRLPHHTALALFFLAAALAVACDDGSSSDPEPDATEPTDTELDSQTSPPDLTVDGTALVDATEDATDDVPDVDEPPLVPPEHQRELAEAATGPLSAGVSSISIDAPIGISMGGYGGRDGDEESPWADIFYASQGTHGELLVKAVAMEVDGERVVLVKVPLPFSEDSLTFRAIEILAEDHGLDLGGRLITAATHTHHGPARFWRLPQSLGVSGIDNPDEEVIELLSRRIAQAAADAVADLAPAEWTFVQRDDWDPENRVYRDRRSVNDDLWGKDPQLTVLAFRRPGATPFAVVANFAMHGTILSDSNRLLSDDAGGGFEEVLERAAFERWDAPTVGLFTQAGGGDASPAGSWLGHQSFQRTQMVGEGGAYTVVDALEGATWESDTELAVRSRLVGIEHPWIYGDSGEFDQTPGVGYPYGTLSCTIDPDPESPVSQPGQTKNCVDVAFLFDALGAVPPSAETQQTYQTVARLGGLFMMTLPGEPTYSLVDYARQEMATISDDHALMVLGYAQDHKLYLTHPDDWYLGEYEAEFSIWGPFAGRWLVDKNLQLVGDMLEGYNAPVYYEERDTLVAPEPWTPRAIEISTGAGVVVEDITGTAVRGAAIDAVVGGGDPSLGLPRAVVEVETEAGQWVPADDGSGRPLDNRDPSILTLYVPATPTTTIPAPERDHRWAFRWKVPIDLPAGRYRLQVSGEAVVDGPTTAWNATVGPFDVGADPTATLEAALVADAVELRWTSAPQPYAEATEMTGVPAANWVVDDPTVGPDERQRVRRPLSVQFQSGGSLDPEVFTSVWDPTAGVHRVDISTAGFDPTGPPLRARAWIADDIAPVVLEADVP